MKGKIYEWKTLKESDKNHTDIEEYLRFFNQYQNEIKDSKKIIGKFDSRNIFERNKDIVNYGNNVGVLSLEEDCTIEFIPKFDNESTESLNFWKFLPQMLGTVSNFDDFSDKLFLDPEKKIVLPEGISIVSLLTLSFISICRKVLEKGIIKKYVLKNERLKAIKGKINYSEMSRKNSWDYSTVPCTYNDLTFDNAENRIILWCAYRLLKEIQKLDKKGNMYVGKKLREIFIMLNEEITLKPQSISSFRKINLSGISHHYLDIMNICKAILSEKLFSFKEGGKKNYGINFIIDMDWVFESYMTYLFYEVANEFYKDKITIKSQEIGRLCDNEQIKIRPDLMIEINGKTKSIVDFKWKSHKQNINADFYQIICYSLAEIQRNSRSEMEAALFSVSDNKSFDENEKFDSISNLIDNSKIHIRKIPLDSVLLKNPPETIKEIIKSEVIRKYLDFLLKENESKYEPDK